MIFDELAFFADYITVFVADLEFSYGTTKGIYLYACIIICLQVTLTFDSDLILILYTSSKVTVGGEGSTD